MAQLTCPHCQGTFQLDLSIPAAQFACPHCGGVVDSPTAPPALHAPQPENATRLAPYAAPEVPPTQDPPVVEASVSQEPVAPPARISAPPLPEVTAPPTYDTSAPMHVIEAAVPSSDSEAHMSERTLRHYSSEEKAHRRFVKNFIVWVTCAIVLVGLLLFFLKK